MVVSQPFPRTTPESVGLPSKAIEAFLHNAAKSDIELHSLMILRHGQVCAEGWWKPYGPEKLHNVHSFTKTFVATAIGLLVEDGVISLEDKILSFFPEEAPENPSENLKKMNLQHLLSMSTGQHDEPNIRGEKNFVRAFFAWPVEHEPGTWFRYNSQASHMLGLVVHKVTGKDFPEFLRERILDKMGFGKMECALNADGHPSGGGGYALTTEDMARLGQLYLDGGKWKGEQLVPAHWIREATVPQSDNSNGEHRAGNEDWEAGYGYQLWMNDPLQSYRFDGAFGQEALVYPAQDLLVICTAATENIAGLFKLAERFLMNQVVDGVLPENPTAWAHVQELLNNLHLDEVKKSAASWLQEKACGQKLALEKNEIVPFLAGFGARSARTPGICAITPVFGEGQVALTVDTPDQAWTIQAGMAGEALQNILDVDGKEMEIYASAYWKEQNVLVVSCRTMRAVYGLNFEITYGLEGAKVQVHLAPARNNKKLLAACYA